MTGRWMRLALLGALAQPGASSAEEQGTRLLSGWLYSSLTRIGFGV